MTPEIKITNKSFIIGPRSWPYILLTLMIILAFIGLVRSYIFTKKTKEVEGKVEEGKNIPKRTIYKLSLPMVSLGLVILYVTLLNWIGFIVSSTLFLYGITLLLGQRKHLSAIIFAVITTAIFVFLFSILLSNPLPRGIGVFRQFSLLFY